MSAQVKGMVPLAQYARRFLEYHPVLAAGSAPGSAASQGCACQPHTLPEHGSFSKHPAHQPTMKCMLLHLTGGMWTKRMLPVRAMYTKHRLPTLLFQVPSTPHSRRPSRLLLC